MDLELIPLSLLEAYKSKKLLPIVGAGVSMSLKNIKGDKLFPSWKELLVKAADRLRDEGKVDHADAMAALIKVEMYGQAADIMRDNLKGKLWGNFFKETFDINFKEIDQNTCLLPKKIWELSKQIVTLNYDKVLRYACPTLNVMELDNSMCEGIGRFVVDDREAYKVWHLHGRIDVPGDIIFTSNSYKLLYQDTSSVNEAALKVFQSLCREMQLIFVGCSLDDAEILKQMVDEHDLFKGATGPHYVLVKESHASEIKAKLSNLDMIEIVTFSDFGQPLLDVLDKISNPKVYTTHSSETINETAKTETHISKSVRISVLAANPIDKDYQYSEITNELRKLKAEISFFHLNLKTLNDLTGFDYIFVLSKCVKKKIVIEDEVMTSSLIDLKELEYNIGNLGTKGIFVFLDYTKDIEVDLCGIEEFNSPLVILPKLTKTEVNSFVYKVFRKKDFSFTSNSFHSDLKSLKIVELNCPTKEISNRTKLPSSIDPRSTKNYVGRKNDLENISRKILEIRSKGEILSIKGSGGIGKTATIKKLIVEIADRGYFQDGIDFIDCEFIEDYKSFEDNVAKCFNLENALRVKDEISEKYSNENRVILLDNFETLLHISDTDSIKDFLVFLSKYSALVVTTRETIGLEGEQSYELRPFTTDEAFELFCTELPWQNNFTDKDKQLIRQEILEQLLDNNPLAIKLITKNIPKGKSFIDLKNELNTNIFQKVSQSELELFDRASDTNIERKKSLYGSINFSYQLLNDKEKVAFELLSLFPDGINLESFKRFTDQIRSSKAKPEKNSKLTEELLINDPVIRALENKSLIQNDNRLIKLQSIIGKFADRKLLERKSEELKHFYRNAFQFNKSFTRALAANSLKNNNQVMRTFNNFQNNFIKCLRYISRFPFDHEEFMGYLDNLHYFFIEIGSCRSLIHALEEEKISFEDEIKQSCLEIIILSLKYYDGEFSKSYAKLQEKLPLSEVLNFENSNFFDSLRAYIASHLYGFEGESIPYLKIKIIRERNYGTYPVELYQLGYFNKELIEKSYMEFSSLEALYCLGLLTEQQIDSHIKTHVYEKSHLEKTQIYYLKAKIGCVSKKIINSLVVVNPYTEGIKHLMYAFIESNYDIIKNHYLQALNNLSHIKYYYVEALYFYAKFLKDNLNQHDFESINTLGYKLSKKHYYRYLSYKFEILAGIKSGPYDRLDYPLPDDMDSEIDLYTSKLIKMRM